MHQAIARAFEEIDAAVFSGDTFSTDWDSLAKLKMYVERWTRALPDLEDALMDFEENQTDFEEDQDDDEE